MSDLPADSPLDRAIAALAAAGKPEGPSAGALDRAQAAALAASTPRPRTKTRKLMFMTLKLAAAALIGAFALPHLAGPPVVAGSPYAEATRRLKEARSLSYLITINFPGVDKPLATRTLLKGPSLARAESGPDIVSIANLGAGRLMVLDNKAKTAVLMDLKELPPAPAGDASKGLRELAEKQGKPVGKRQIGGVEAEGFEVVLAGQEWTLWIDPKANLPVRVDIKGTIMGKAYTGAITEFALDPPLDDALFATEPPAGYAVSKSRAPTFAPPEEVVARVLKLYAAKFDGKLPPRLDDLATFEKVYPVTEPGQALKPELTQAVQDVVRVAMLKLELAGGYGYRPEGVKPGDADTIIFWYKPAGKATYRAVYGDLRVGDLEAGKVPKP